MSFTMSQRNGLGVINYFTMHMNMLFVYRGGREINCYMLSFRCFEFRQVSIARYIRKTS